MGVRVTTPHTIASDAASLVAGDTLELGAGIYRQAVSFSRLQGAPGQPIRIRAQPGAVFDAGLPMPKRWPPANTDGVRPPLGPGDPDPPAR